MSWARRYALRNVAFTVTRSASDYGTGLYGDSSYGTEASDPLSNVEYVLAADPGEWPSFSGWAYRVGDIGSVFRAIALGLDGPLDLTPVSSAALVIERAGVGNRVVLGFPLEIDAVNNRMTYSFTEGDLTHQGVYRAAVQLIFTSGRAMTITPDDSTTFLVRGVD